MRNGISIIIPTYNREKLVAKAIQSVADQEFDGKIEIIIADDGSTDRTLSVVESFGNKVILLKKPLNCKDQGVASTRNRALKIATQPFISFLDSDDFYLRGHIKKMVSVLEDNPDLGFVFCRMLKLKEENGKKLFRPWTHEHIFKKDILNPVVSRSNIAHTNSLLFRKEVFETVGNFNETYTNFEDIDLWMRISEKFKGAFSNHYGAVYRTQHAESQLTNNSFDVILNCRSKIQEEAISRYYELKLNDPYRIFELKHLMLHGQYENNKWVYGIKYIKLIISNPFQFLHRCKTLFFVLFENREKRRWGDLQNFLTK